MKKLQFQKSLMLVILFFQEEQSSLHPFFNQNQMQTEETENVEEWKWISIAFIFIFYSSSIVDITMKLSIQTNNNCGNKATDTPVFKSKSCSQSNKWKFIYKMNSWPIL